MSETTTAYSTDTLRRIVQAFGPRLDDYRTLYGMATESGITKDEARRVVADHPDWFPYTGVKLGGEPVYRVDAKALPADLRP